MDWQTDRLTEPIINLIERFMKIQLTYAPSNILNVNTYTDTSGVEKMYGIMYKVTKLVAASLNASFSLDPPPDNQWGSIVVTGK